MIKGRLLQVTSPDLFGQALEVEGGGPVSSLTTHSGRRVLWQCGQGHEWWATVASRSSGSGCPRCSVPGRSLFEEEVAELLRAATHVLVLTDVAVRVGRRRWRIDLKVVTPTPLMIDLDPPPWHAREGSAERDQRKLEAMASPDYIRVRQGGLPPLVGRTRNVSDRKKLDPWEWAEAVRDDVVSAGGAWATVQNKNAQMLGACLRSLAASDRARA